MTTVHAKLIGKDTIVPKDEFDRLVELARKTEAVEVRVQTDEAASLGIMRLAEGDKSFEWLSDEPDLYSIDDLKVRYR